MRNTSLGITCVIACTLCATPHAAGQRPNIELTGGEFTPPPSPPKPPLNVKITGDIDIDGGSKWFGLAKDVPTGADFLGMVGSWLQDQAISSQLDDQLRKLSDVLERDVPAQGGLLVKVNLYVSEAGIALVPDGQLLLVLGPGDNPIDAAAESLRGDALTTLRPRGMRDSTSLIWVTPRDGKLIGVPIPVAATRDVMKQARAEADLRDKLGIYDKTFYGDIGRDLTDANFWATFELDRGHKIRTFAKREQVRQLTQQMTALQEEVNTLAREYRKTEHEMVAAQRQMRALELTGLIAGAAQTFGSMSSGVEDRPAAGSTASSVPYRDQNAKIEFLRVKFTNGKQTLDIQRTRIQGIHSQMPSLDFKLREIYTSEGVPIPARH